eukprot:s19_g37.t1
MLRQSDEDFKIVDELRAIQETVSAGHVKVHDFHGATLHTFKTFLSLASHHLKPDDLKPVAVAKASEKDFSVLDAPASCIADAPTATATAYQQKLAEMERLTGDFTRAQKAYKAQVKQLLEESRSMEVLLRVRYLSGRGEIDVATELRKTIKKFKEEDLSRQIAKQVVLMYGGERLEDNRRLFGYGIRAGSVLDVAVINTQKVENDIFLKVEFALAYTDEDGVRRPTIARAEETPFQVCVSSTTTVTQMIGSVLTGMRQNTILQGPDRRFLYFFKGNHLNIELHETLAKDLGVNSNDIIIVNVYDKNDRVYRLAIGQDVNDNEEEESSGDEQDFEEVEGDGFMYGFAEAEQIDDELPPSQDNAAFEAELIKTCEAAELSKAPNTTGFLQGGVPGFSTGASSSTTTITTTNGTDAQQLSHEPSQVPQQGETPTQIDTLEDFGDNMRDQLIDVHVIFEDPLLFTVQMRVGTTAGQVVQACCKLANVDETTIAIQTGVGTQISLSAEMHQDAIVKLVPVRHTQGSACQAHLPSDLRHPFALQGGTRETLLWQQHGVATDEMQFYLNTLQAYLVECHPPVHIHNDEDAKTNICQVIIDILQTAGQNQVVQCIPILYDQHWFPIAATAITDKPTILTTTMQAAFLRDCIVTAFDQHVIDVHAAGIGHAFHADCGFQTLGWIIERATASEHTQPITLEEAVSCTFVC